MGDKERKQRDSERISYLENELELWIENDKDTFLQTVAARVLSAAEDVFGLNCPAMRFLENTLKTGKPHPAKFNEVVLFHGTSLVKVENAQALGRSMAYELLRIHNREIQYYIENNLYGWWEDLEAAGMSHDNIGRYFEGFDQDVSG